MSSGIQEQPILRSRVRRDLQTVRDVLRRVRTDERLMEVGLFGSRVPRATDEPERRRHRRSALRMPVYVTLVDYDGEFVRFPQNAEVFLGLTRDLSLRGVGFTHDDYLEGDYALATLELLQGPPVSLLLELRWANHGGPYSFHSGGRFAGVVEDGQWPEGT